MAKKINMKAAVCHEFGQPLVIQEIEIDPPHAGEVRVQLATCAICHSDIHYIEGAWGGKLPAVYGHEAAGRVREVGAGVTSVKAGDPVVVSLIRSCGRCFYCMQGTLHLCETSFALDRENRLHGKDGMAIHQGLRTGAFAEYVVVDESQIVEVPAEMPMDSAALLACGVITGLGAVVNTAQIPAGSSVVIIGTGGVGMNSVQGARLAGAHPIVAVDLAENKLDLARSLGATHTVNPSKVGLKEAVYALTEGRGADYVLVTVGSAQAMEQGVELLRRGGTLVLVGMPAYGETMRIEATDLADKSLRILGSKMGSTHLRVDVPRMVEFYQRDRLRLDELITARYPLEEINEAIAAVKGGTALRNVIVF